MPKERLFGLEVRLIARRWCHPDRDVLLIEELPQEAKAVFYREDNRRLLYLIRGSHWLARENESQLEVAILAIGGTWSSEEAERLRRVLEPMIPGDEPPASQVKCYIVKMT